MSVSSELMYAILAMDAYNRGYNPGIVGLGGMGSQIGTATVGIDADDPEGVAQAAGFYAVAYQWNGETIISYRGTDAKPELVTVDLPIALQDDYDEDQIQLASSFYQAVVAATGSSANIKLTGHSLGGALAGFVGGCLRQGHGGL
ncbi:MAG: Mbeg1-like protein [Nitrospirales bacterium]